MGILLAQLLFAGIATGSFYALSAVSWGVIYRTTRIFHFAHHLVFTIAAYAAVIVATGFGLHYLWGLLGAVVVSVLAGCATEVLLYRNLRRRNARQVNVFLASLGLATAGVAAMLLLFSSNPRPIAGFPKTILSIGPIFFPIVDLVTFLSSWAIIGALLLFLFKSRYGKAIVATGGNAELAENIGINADRIFLLVFAIGSALFGVAAFLFAAKNVATPTMGLQPFFIAFSAVFLGGVNNIFGQAVAGFTLGVVENLGMLFLPGEYRTMIAFAVLFIVIVIKPKGILSPRGA